MTVLIQPYATPNRVGVSLRYESNILSHHLHLISECCGEGVVWDQENSDGTAPLWMCSECKARVENGANRSAEVLTDLTTAVQLKRWISEATGIEQERLTVEIDWA